MKIRAFFMALLCCEKKNFCLSILEYDLVALSKALNLHTPFMDVFGLHWLLKKKSQNIQIWHLWTVYLVAQSLEILFKLKLMYSLDANDVAVAFWR